MPEPLKNLFFTRESIQSFADEIASNYQQFDKAKFLSLIYDKDWQKRELKDKMRQTTICLHKTLPEEYSHAIEILMNSSGKIKGFEVMVLPDYVELYGKEDWELSMKALGHFTRFGSSEFAIRPFLDKEPGKTMKQMLLWTDDKSENVRRFASEGCRPRLPWAMALPKFKKDPSEFVRKSVANNLNDISKDNPEKVLGICEKWHGKSIRTDWIIKHGCRTMLKAGNKRAMILFGFGDPVNITVENLVLNRKKIKIGEELQFSFNLNIKEAKPVKARLEYKVDFIKANGKTSPKIFQIIEQDYKPGIHIIKRRRSFADMSTRKHYPGEHRLTFIVNGEEKGSVKFFLDKSI